MSLVSIAFVNVNDELLFAKEFPSKRYGSIDFEEPEKDCSLRQQFILQSGLETFHQILQKGSDTWRESGTQGTDAMFLGLLSIEDEFRLYGTYLSLSLASIYIVYLHHLSLSLLFFLV